MLKTLSLFGLAMALLVGCATESLSKAELDARQQSIESQYAAAQLVYKQNMAPVAQYMVKVCAPMADRDYIDCINAKREEISTLNIYPEDPHSLEQRMALEQQLLNRQISRKEFRSKLEAIKVGNDAERLEQDISAGVYSGKY